MLYMSTSSLLGGGCAVITSIWFYLFANSDPVVKRIYFKSPFLMQWLVMAMFPCSGSQMCLWKAHLCRLSCLGPSVYHTVLLTEAMPPVKTIWESFSFMFSSSLASFSTWSSGNGSWDITMMPLHLQPTPYNANCAMTRRLTCLFKYIVREDNEAHIYNLSIYVHI